MRRERAVVMTSGGLDSTVLLYWVLAQGYDALPMFLNYGQHCAEAELRTLRGILPPALIDHVEIVNVVDVFRTSESRLIREPDLWKEKIASSQIMLPYRNLFLIVTGAAFAASRGAGKLFSAFINSNHAYEIDATTAFLASAEGLVAGCGDVKLEMPFRTYSKSEVARLGLELNAPIARTYSCQVSSIEHCGACPNCVERLTALANVMLATSS